MKKTILTIFAIAGLSLFVTSCDDPKDVYVGGKSIYKIDWTAAADSSSTSFVSVYWNKEKHHFNNDDKGNTAWNDYWPEAHGLDVLVDAYARTKNEAYKARISEFYEGVKAKNDILNGGRGFWNNFYDDMGWHGMAHLRALEATGDQRYEESAKDLWVWITDGWSDHQGGGIPWNHENTEDGMSKGVPSNGPAAIIAARRWQKYGEAEVVNGHNNLVWLDMIYTWMKEHCTEPQTGRVYEKIDNVQGDWTYNAGTFMGAALEYYKITNDKVYLHDAIKTADRATLTLINSNNKVLSDWAEQENHDVNLFKGIFVRYLTQLILHDDVPADAKGRYVRFMKNSGQVLWTEGTQKSSTILFGYKWWEKPTENEMAGLRAQLSGAMMMESMAVLKAKGFVD